MLSVSSLLTAAVHRPESLRGLSRWTLSFITNGPNARFWKRRLNHSSAPPTPSVPPRIDQSHLPESIVHSPNRISQT